MTNKEVKIGCSRIAAGECYLATLKLVLRHQHELGRNEVLSILPANMLAGFALELLLKGYLILNGESPRTVEGYRHRINDLVTRAKLYGMSSVHQLDELAVGLGKGHADLKYRYIDPGEEFPGSHWPQVLPIFDAMMPELKRALEATQNPA